MKDIIIVGKGKAGKLHFKSYKKINEVGKIYFVDKNKSYKKNVYKSVNELLVEKNLDKENIIVDICTHKEEFYDVINECIVLGIKNIIVEKPFIISKEFIDENPKLNIMMVQNYLYSKIINEIKSKVKEEKLKIKFIYTNFSKNRKKDSKKRRGMSYKVTNNFEIEIPHQIYLVEYILGNTRKKEIIYKEQKDFEDKNIILKKHGYGKIIMIYDSITVIHESDLITNNCIKEITLICEEGVVIKGEFILYNEELDKIKNGRIIVINKQKIIWEKEITEDDNMYFCLKEYYEAFNNNINNKYKKRLLEFSNIFKKLIE